MRLSLVPLRTTSTASFARRGFLVGLDDISRYVVVKAWLKLRREDLKSHFVCVEEGRFELCTAASRQGRGAFGIISVARRGEIPQGYLRNSR